jgi:hypothetical protein
MISFAEASIARLSIHRVGNKLQNEYVILSKASVPLGDSLKLKVRNDNYHQTSNVPGVYKNFVMQQLDNEFEFPDQPVARKLC